MTAAPNPGYNTGLKKRSKLERLAWAWKGAEASLKVAAQERKLSPMQAVHEGRELSETISRKLFQNGISRNDAKVGLAFAKPDNVHKLAALVIFETPDPNADSNDLIAMRENLRNVPVGFLVWVIDRKNRDAEGRIPFISHARPLIFKDRPLRLLESLVKESAKLDWGVS
jgi:hypothetical protein